MTDTPPITPPTIEPNPDTIVPRIAVPFFSFSFVLFGAFLASQTFLLPKLTTFTVGDVDVSVDEAIAYERQLRAEVISLEDKRTELVLPYIDDAHDALMKAKRDAPSIVAIRTDVERAMHAIAEKTGGSATVDAMHIDNDTSRVTVRGSVFDPSPSSMATLAAAIDAVRALPGITDLNPPALTREKVDGGYRSPFRFTFIVQ